MTMTVEITRMSHQTVRTQHVLRATYSVTQQADVYQRHGSVMVTRTVDLMTTVMNPLDKCSKCTYDLSLSFCAF